MHDLHQKAHNFINSAPYFEKIRSYGSLYFTGSYVLNTMTWPDIDMQLCLDKDQDAKEVISVLTTYLIKTEGIQKVQYRDFRAHPHPSMPLGLYLGATYFDEGIKGYWKLDLWLLSSFDFEQNKILMDLLKQRMMPDHHALIMAIKKEWTVLYGRPPKMASYYLYQAIVLANLKDRTEIDSYLRIKGVEV